MSNFPRWLRIAGKHAPATTVLRNAAPWLEARGIAVQLPTEEVSYDYAQVDPLLETLDGVAEYPAATLSYAGFSPEQRGAYLHWAEKPAEPLKRSGGEQTPAAFKRLYCAGLEVTLIEHTATKKNADTKPLLDLLEALAAARHWRSDTFLSRLLLLATRLTGEVDLVDLASLEPSLTGVMLGVTAQSHTARLTPAGALHLAKTWHITQSPPSTTLTALRLDELAVAPEGDLLQRALQNLPEAALASKPFHTAHRDLRLAFSQPDLRPTLEPMLAEVLASIEHAMEDEESVLQEAIEEIAPTPPPLPKEKGTRTAKAKGTASDKEQEKNKDWSLVMEFSESRSPYATFALDLAQKQPGYTTLLDEDRTIVHRVVFRKSEMRRFWRLWEYVQGWNSTHVYLNGDELQKWQVWPWSQVFR